MVLLHFFSNFIIAFLATLYSYFIMTPKIPLRYNICLFIILVASLMIYEALVKEEAHLQLAITLGICSITNLYWGISQRSFAVAGFGCLLLYIAYGHCKDWMKCNEKI